LYNTPELSTFLAYRYRLRDILIATSFLAILEGSYLIYLRTTQEFIVGFDSVFVAMGLLVWLVVITFVFAILLKNVTLGILSLFIFYLSAASMDLSKSEATLSSVVLDCGSSFCVHTIFYSCVAILAQKASDYGCKLENTQDH